MGSATVVLICIAMFAPAHSALPQGCKHGENETAQEKARKVDAVNVLRLLNTAELTYFQTNHRYAILFALASSDALKTTEAAQSFGGVVQKISLCKGKEVLPGFDLQLTSGGDSYTVAIHDTTDPCRLSFFSDESGLIYQGQPIG